MHCYSEKMVSAQLPANQDESSDSNRRKENRVPLLDGLYVIIHTHPQTMGQAVDISSTGMSFTFVDLDDVSKRLAEQSGLHIDLYAGGHGFYVKNVACRLVSEMESAPSSFVSSLSIRRIGIEFKKLSILQQVQINQIVRRQSTGFHH